MNVYLSLIYCPLFKPHFSCWFQYIVYLFLRVLRRLSTNRCRSHSPELCSDSELIKFDAISINLKLSSGKLFPIIIFLLALSNIWKQISMLSWNKSATTGPILSFLSPHLSEKSRMYGGGISIYSFHNGIMMFLFFEQSITHSPWSNNLFTKETTQSKFAAFESINKLQNGQ